MKMPGCWLSHPSEKYESQWEGLSHILWKITNVPNHQPDAVQGHLGAISRTVVKLITGLRRGKKIQETYPAVI